MPVRIDRTNKPHIKRSVGTAATIKPLSVVRELNTTTVVEKQVATTTDTAIATAVNDPASQARTALDDAFAPRAAYTVATRGFAPVVAPVASMISALQAGHGWTNIGGTATLNDTSDYVLGTQSAKIATNGTGTATSFDKTGLTVDATGKFFRLWLKVSDWSKLNTMQMYVGDGTLANNVNGQILNGPGYRETQSFIRSGEWTVMDVPYSDLITVAGAPNRAAIARIRLTFTDRGNGPVTVSLNGLALVDEPVGRYPNGVVSLTFDDNPSSAFTVARPYLDKYGYAGTLYPVIDRIGAAGSMTVAQMLQLQNQNGWDFGAHASTLQRHTSGFQNMTEAELTTEFETIRNWMRDNGLRGESYAWPNGDSSPLAEKIASRYFRSGRSIYYRTHEVVPPTNPFRLRALNATGYSLAQLQAEVDRAKAGRHWLVLIFHDIVTTPSALNDVATATFQGLVDYLNTQQMAVRTVSQVLGGN